MRGFTPNRTGLGPLSWTLLVSATAASLAAEWVLPEAGHSPGHRVPGLEALIGFLSGVVAVVLARLAGWALKREEGYYDA